MSLILTVTDRYAGNNYRIDVTPIGHSNTILANSPTFVAWKRVYLEIDRMYRQPGFHQEPEYEPSSDIIGYAGPESDWVTVTNPGIFNIGEEVRLIDGAHTDGESFWVSEVQGNSIDLAWAPNYRYYGGYDEPSGRGAALVKADAQCFMHDLLGRIKEAYGDISDPSGKNKPGCFVQFKKCPTGHNYVPYKAPLDTYEKRKSFSHVWFANSGQRNAVHLLLVHDLDVKGMSYKVDHYSFVAWKKAPINIPKTLVDEELVDLQASAAHELCHQFWIDVYLSDTPTDNNHRDIHSWSWKTNMPKYKGACVMDTSNRHSYDYDMPCHFCRPHLMKIRNNSDNL